MSAASVCILLGLVLFVVALAALPYALEAGMSAAPGADKYGMLAPLGVLALGVAGVVMIVYGAVATWSW